MVTVILWTSLACSGASETTSCDDATITLESIALAPKGMAGIEGIVCGSIYEARDDGITNQCGDTGLGDPIVREDTYAVWPSDWGLERRGYAVGVVVLDSDGVTEITGLPDENPGDSISVRATVRYDQVYDVCSNSLFGSAYLEIAVSELNMD